MERDSYFVGMVSVYIPTFDRVGLLRKAVNSVLRQTYRNFELIVVDDGSSDGTVSYLKEMQKKGLLKFYINEGRKGACGARNTAIKYARGEFVTGLDDDDEFFAERLERLLEAYNPIKMSAVASSYMVKKNGAYKVRASDVGVVTLSLLMFYNRVGNQVLTRLDNLQALGGFDEEFPAFQDYDLWVRLCQEFGPILKIPDPLYLLNEDAPNGRISSHSVGKVYAHDIFIEKHEKVMRDEHFKTHLLLRKKMEGEKIGFWEAVRAISFENWRFVVSCFFRRGA